MDVAAAGTFLASHRLLTCRQRFLRLAVIWHIFKYLQQGHHVLRNESLSSYDGQRGFPAINSRPSVGERKNWELYPINLLGRKLVGRASVDGTSIRFAVPATQHRFSRGGAEGNPRNHGGLIEWIPRFAGQPSKPVNSAYHNRLRETPSEVTVALRDHVLDFFREGKAGDTGYSDFAQSMWVTRHGSLGVIFQVIEGRFSSGVRQSGVLREDGYLPCFDSGRAALAQKRRIRIGMHRRSKFRQWGSWSSPELGVARPLPTDDYFFAKKSLRGLQFGRRAGKWFSSSCNELRVGGGLQFFCKKNHGCGWRAFALRTREVSMRRFGHVGVDNRRKPGLSGGGGGVLFFGSEKFHPSDFRLIVEAQSPVWEGVVYWTYYVFADGEAATAGTGDPPGPRLPGGGRGLGTRDSCSGTNPEILLVGRWLGVMGRSGFSGSTGSIGTAAHFRTNVLLTIGPRSISTFRRGGRASHQSVLKALGGGLVFGHGSNRFSDHCEKFSDPSAGLRKTGSLAVTQEAGSEFWDSLRVTHGLPPFQPWFRVILVSYGGGRQSIFQTFR